MMVAALALLMILAAQGVAAPAAADTFTLDNFSVNRNGTVIFNDPFNDGTLISPSSPAPNFSDGTATNYFVTGTVPESGGRAQLNPANGVQVAQPDPFIPFVTQVDVTLQTGTTVAGTHTLTAATTFSAIGLFDLQVPSVILGTYDIHLSDRATAMNLPGDDIIQLRVRNLATGPVIQFAHVDFLDSQFTQLGVTPLDPNHQQILLELSHGTAGTNTITASYAYVDGGVVGSLTTFPTSVDIFDAAAFTRPGFDAFAPAPVPEPSSLLFLTIGAVGLGGLAWRRRHRK